MSENSHKQLVAEAAAGGENSKQKENLLKEIGSNKTFNYILARVRTRGLNEADSQELAQNIWIELTKKIRDDKYDYDKRWQGLLETMVSRRVINRRKSVAYREGNFADLEDHAFHLSSSDTGAETAVGSSEIKNKIREAIRALPRDLQPVITMHMEEKSNAQIATELGIGANTVAKRLKIAMEALRKELDKEEGIKEALKEAA